MSTTTTTPSNSRRTIIMEDDILKKLRAIQSKMIKDSDNSISFSKVCNNVLRRGLKQ